MALLRDLIRSSIDDERRRLDVLAEARSGEPRVVWKYTLDFTGPGPWRELELPAGAVVLSVGLQGAHCVVLWALCNAHAVPVRRRFMLVETGREFAEAAPYRFVGTVQIPAALTASGEYVLHLFELFS
jgi:hypothetical protein